MKILLSAKCKNISREFCRETEGGVPKMYLGVKAILLRIEE